MRYRPAEGSTERARALRGNATDAERQMWRILRSAFPKARFRRQVPIRSFIVDFASHRERVVIECDGGQHDEGVDGCRSSLIVAEGYRILRFWNNDVLDNPDGVHSAIELALARPHPHPASPIKGEEH